MHIAFITYEFPPDIAQGGIATYVRQVAKILSARNHNVEVFSASPTREGTYQEEGIIVHRVKCENPGSFNLLIIDVFSKRHILEPFDIFETPEIHGHGYCIKKQYPDLPMIVKFHMPLFLQMRLLNYHTSLISKIRYFLGGLIRGKLSIYGSYTFNDDIDYKVTCMADACVSPSLSLASILCRKWKLKRDDVSIIPNPFTPPLKLLGLPIVHRKTKVVSFIGKLNVHKGLVILITVIKKVVKKHPDVIFRLIGNDSYFNLQRMSMSDYVRKRLIGLEKNYQIRGGLDYEQIMDELSVADVCIFPSIWENFPNVCLEAMSAGRAIVASKNGGMSEMLANDCGILVDPLNAKEIAESISMTLDSPDKRIYYGKKAREEVLSRYNHERVGRMLEEHYINVINDTR